MGETEKGMSITKIPEKKTLGFVALGIILYTGSSYMNTLKDNVADIGLYFGIGLIMLGASAQIVNWVKYWKKN